jgi:rhodanese-related sulfurtransferase
MVTVRAGEPVPSTGISIDELLDRARARLRRLAPADAYAAMARGAVLVDVRSESQREQDGVVPGSVFVPRNVLEWRADPRSGYADPVIVARRGALIVLCAEGYQSSLAAATLHELGLTDATDVVGGFAAWRAARVPVVLARSGRGRHGVC